MIIYNYSSNTKEFLNSCDASLDKEATRAEGKNIYYLPANATFVRPPKTQSFEVAIYDNGWQICSDFRGCWMVDSSMQPQKMTEIGNLPEGFIYITDAQYAKIIEDKDFYIISDGELIINPGYEQLKYQENISALTQDTYLLKATKAYGGVILNNTYVFETNEISITNTVASLALMGTKTNWKFYNLNGYPVSIELSKSQLTTIAKFGRKMMEDCFYIEGMANATIAQAPIEQINNAQWRNDFIAQVREQIEAVNNKIEMEL